MPPSPRAPSLAGQVLTCVLLTALAALTTALMHPAPQFGTWVGGVPVRVQLLVAAAFAAACSVGAAIVLLVPRLRRLVKVPGSLREIDLSGPTPWIVGICAGVGEELLFRAALQPLVGLWVGAVVFTAAHARTAMFASQSYLKRAVYLVNVFAAGVVLGLVFEHLGLVAAILIHATVDIAGLLVLRKLTTYHALSAVEQAART
jgi:membrane protease YdiL (CAAX protease family)